MQHYSLTASKLSGGGGFNFVSSCVAFKTHISWALSGEPAFTILYRKKAAGFILWGKLRWNTKYVQEKRIRNEENKAKRTLVCVYLELRNK